MVRRTTYAALGAIVLLPLSAAHASPEATAGLEAIDPSLPPAALEPAPSLPVPDGWPFPETFPRTSGTQRFDAGAVYWSDFLYDDYGARGLPAHSNPVTARPPAGSFGYSDPAAHNNGADIFRAAVGIRGERTYWRVDWNTLEDPSVPIALFAIEADAGSGTSDPWPSNVDLRGGTPDRFLLVSAAGAWLIDDGGTTVVTSIGGTHDVDLQARSFVVSLASGAVPTTGSTRIRLVSGLADDAGTGFRQLGPSEGALPGQPNVYNVAFRSYDVEPALDNPWMDAAQADRLTDGDVTPFYLDIDWALLRAGAATPEPRPTGFSNRWYVSSIELGPGYTDNGDSDIEPVFLGRVQPYAVYVPHDYEGEPRPLSWLMHSAMTNHNQWYRTNPLAEDGGVPMYDQLCRDRGAICASPLGRSPWGWWMNEAELDFFEVWREIHDAYAIDRDRVTMAGMSLGGWAGYRFGLTYPDLFSAMHVIAGPPACADIGLAAGIGISTPTVNDPERRCVPEIIGAESSGHVGPLVPNARWLPYAIVHDAADPLVPLPSVIEHVGRFQTNDLRYRFGIIPTRGHAGWAYDLDFTFGTTYLDGFEREPNPRSIDYRWYPNNVVADLGIGPHAAWWLRDLRAVADFSPATIARIEAQLGPVATERPDPVRSESVEETPLGPIIVEEQTWQQADPEPTAQELSHAHLALEKVTAFTFDVEAAGLQPSRRAITVTVTSAEAVDIAFPVGPQVAVRSDRGVVRRRPVPTVSLPPGTSTVTLSPGSQARPPSGTDIGATAPEPAVGSEPSHPRTGHVARTPPLPTTGWSNSGLAVLLLGFAFALGRHRPEPTTTTDRR